MDKMKKSFKALLIGIVMLMVGFFIYTSIYYEADEIANSYIEKEEVTLLEEGLLFIEASNPTNQALIFYPGAKVEYTAYLPLASQLVEEVGIHVILVEMPFNLAIFNANRADEVIGMYPNITEWYIGGHSMGGAMASSYASSNPYKVSGLILLGAYVYGDYNPAQAVTIYGSLNQSVEDEIDYSENVVEIDGGNHAQFGNYGEQRGDLEATISQEEQQRQAVEAISNFIESQ